MRRSDIDARLTELYEQVPQPNCKGLCADSCGPIDMHPRERQRIRARGVTIPHHDDALDQLDRDGDYVCPALKNDRCTVYSDRPMICRAWGAVEAMACEHGCRPEGGLMPDQEGAAAAAGVTNLWHAGHRGRRPGAAQAGPAFRRSRVPAGVHRLRPQLSARPPAVKRRASRTAPTAKRPRAGSR